MWLWAFLAKRRAKRKGKKGKKGGSGEKGRVSAPDLEMVVRVMEKEKELEKRNDEKAEVMLVEVRCNEKIEEVVQNGNENEGLGIVDGKVGHFRIQLDPSANCFSNWTIS